MRWQKKAKSIIICVISASYIFLLFWETHSNHNCKNTNVSRPTSRLTFESESTENITNIHDGNLSALVLPEVTSQRRKVAYYMWCDKRIFEFRNYLSILSIVHFMRPEKIFFHYLYLPDMDKLQYNTWFKELQESVGIMILDNSSLTEDICASEQTRTDFMLRTLMSRGGIYVGRNTIFIKSPPDLNARFSNHLFASYQGYAIGQPSNKDVMEVVDMCPLYNEIIADQLDSGGISCIYETRSVYPKHFWTKNDKYAEAVRTLMYGENKMPQPIYRMDALIPNIAHVLWVGGKTMDFLFYLCCLSLIYVVGVDNLYIHGEVPPTGKYWAELQHNNRVTFIERELPNFAFNQRALEVHLMSDIFRGEVMVKYGGIYSDVDVIWTQPLNKTIRSYEAVASLDWSSSFWPYPNYINLGVSLGKRNAPFWREFRRSLRNLRHDIFGFNGLLQPYKIYERHPELLRLDDHLQVMCFRNNCHPLWGVNYQKIDWRRETHAFHWTWPTPKEFSNLPTLLNSTTVWAQIGQHVLRKAGLL